jgi:hypothetical protein
MHVLASETRKLSCMPRAAKPFFIPVVHSPLGSWDTWQHWSSSLGEEDSGAMGQVEVPEPTSAGKGAPKLRDTWQRWSPPQQGGEVRGYGTRGSVRAHLSREARCRATGHVIAPEPTSTGGEVQSYRVCGSTWMHNLLLVLT